MVIADGAAFGAELEKVYRLMEERPDRITLYLPESFEWLILKSGGLWIAAGWTVATPYDVQSTSATNLAGSSQKNPEREVSGFFFTREFIVCKVYQNSQPG